jgi:hypothetical protein
MAAEFASRPVATDQEIESLPALETRIFNDEAYRTGYRSIWLGGQLYAGSSA